MSQSILSVQNLSVEFKLDGGVLPVVGGVSFEVGNGEIVALVGESGCGKSVTCMSLARLLPEPPARYADGKIIFRDELGDWEVLKLSRRKLRWLRGGRIAYIFQEPSSSLNPVFRIGDQIAEAVELHRPEITDIDAECARLLAKVGIPEPEKRLCAYPHEMSGGMQQRVMIAMALASEPKLLVADEPTTALDVTIQAQILDLIRELRADTGMSIIIVTHNLGIVSELADRVMVMYAGQIVESAPTRRVLDTPRHPYTKALLSAVPKIGHRTKRLTTIPGAVPDPADFPAGCRFEKRCAAARGLPMAERALCAEPQPWRDFGAGEGCRCWRTAADA